MRPTGNKVTLQTGKLCEYACGEMLKSTRINARPYVSLSSRSSQPSQSYREIVAASWREIAPACREPVPASCRHRPAAGRSSPGGSLLRLRLDAAARAQRRRGGRLRLRLDAAARALGGREPRDLLVDKALVIELRDVSAHASWITRARPKARVMRQHEMT